MYLKTCTGLQQEHRKPASTKLEEITGGIVGWTVGYVTAVAHSSRIPGFAGIGQLPVVKIVGDDFDIGKINILIGVPGQGVPPEVAIIVKVCIYRSLLLRFRDDNGKMIIHRVFDQLHPLITCYQIGCTAAGTEGIDTIGHE